MQLTTPVAGDKLVGDKFVGEMVGGDKLVDDTVAGALDRALDADQQHLVDRLDLLRVALRTNDATTHDATTGDPRNATADAPRGLYIHGSVGRGKTWLCDAFFASAPTTAKRRVHVHDLFQHLHRAIWQARSSPESTGQDVTDVALDAVLGGLELLYFDEFHVHDAADAVLLTRVLRAVLERGILLIATSNDAPHDLLPSSEFHALIEPAIALIEEHLDVVELGGSLDYRRTELGPVDTPCRAELDSGFASGFWMTQTELDEHSPAGLRRPSVAEHTVLTTNGHDFTARRATDDLVWFHFDELCEGTTSIADYLIWSNDFHTWVIEGLPPLDAATPQARQRFAHIVDVLVDRDVTLHVISDSSRSQFSRAAQPRDAERLHSRLALLRSVS